MLTLGGVNGLGGVKARFTTTDRRGNQSNLESANGKLHSLSE